MKQYYKYLTCSFMFGTLLLTGCQEDEVLNLTTYPENQPSITIADIKGESEVTLNAAYNVDGTLALDGLVSRTYTFSFAASPKDAMVVFEPIVTNIPKENVEISTTGVTLPAGSTEASVTVTLKNEDFSFAQSNYDETIYELGVKATVDGYKIGAEPIESKVIVKKEAYKASCFVVGQKGNTVLFERAYTKGQIVNTEPISYTFKAQLDKPARKNTKVKLGIKGLDEKFVKNITVTPAEIIIPAGQLSSEDITWTITDDFLLQTQEEETHSLVVTASVESEDPVVTVNEKKNFLTFNVNKVFRNFKYIDSKVTSWVELNKTGWSVQMLAGSSNNGNVLIDGKGGSSGGDIYTSGNLLSFTLDMKSEKTIAGLAIDYYSNSGTASSPKKITISTSIDNVNWTAAGTIDTPQSFNHYFEFFTPANARYVKFELSNRWNSYIDLTEIYVYENK